MPEGGPPSPGPPPAARPIDAAEAQALFAPFRSGMTGVLLAVSGGPDSMALMALAACLENPSPLAVATVDHGLRPGSAAEAALVAEAAAALGLPHKTLAWTGPKPATGLQEAARAARYALLAAEARRLGFSHVATAHHADDQAETVLMRLAAGSGIAGLAGMRAQSERDGLALLRPLLGIDKARLVATCAARGLPFVRDPSNADPRYGRTRARATLEALSGEGLSAPRLARLAARAARADEALLQMTERALAEAGLHRTGCVAQADWRRLAGQPEEIRLRALGALVRDAPGDGHPLRLERLEGLLAAVDAAAAQGMRLRRSIGGKIATLQSGGRLTVTNAPLRRRGRRDGTDLE
jgi:tRNA(Ile)-lysidine synthase